MKINKDNLIILTVTIATAVLFYNMLLKLQIKQLKAVRTQYVSQNNLVKVRKIKKEEINRSRNTAKDWEVKVKGIEKKFLERKKITSFFKQLDYLAKKSRVKINSVDPLEKKGFKKAGVEEICIMINAEGRYQSIISFVNQLFNDEKLLKISDVDITTLDDKNKTMLEMSMTITLFIVEN